MTITLEARNFRGLRNIRWTPSGVSVLVGPNGAGKSTLLALISFFHDLYVSGVQKAVELQGGPWGLRHLEAAIDEPVIVALSINDLRWEFEFLRSEGSDVPRYRELCTRSDNEWLTLHGFSHQSTYITNRAEIGQTGFPVGLQRVVRQPNILASFEPVVTAVTNFRLYQSWNLTSLRRNSSQSDSDVVLNATGENGFAVLRNWHSRREHYLKFEFVVQGLRTAFPELCENLDFNFDGPTIKVEMNMPGVKEPIPAAFAPSGWLTALLHLCAVAGGEPGSLVAIDEMENTLHPHAIRKLIECFRDWSDEHEITVCLATHSPVVLNEFKEEPEHVFVLEYGQETGPVPLAELYDNDWLARFALGDLYEHGEFGGQRKETTPPVSAAQGS